MKFICNGREVRNWKSISVSASIKEAARTFQVSASDTSTDPLFAEPGSPVQIYTSDGDLLLDGFVNELSPSFTAESHDLKCSGQSRTQDAVDSSAKHPTGLFKDKTPVEIANELSQVVGVTYSAIDSMPKLKLFNINVGETIHQVARRLASAYGYSLMSDGGGEVQFVRSDRADLMGELSEGVFPLKEASATLSDVNLFSDFEFRSQLSAADGKFATEAAHHVAHVRDSRATRYRPFVGIMDKSADSASAAVRADWQARRISGGSATVDATIFGHHLNGALVAPNRKVFVNSAFLRIAHEMLIESVTWTMSEESGSLSSFKLVPPEDYGAPAAAGAPRNPEAADAATGKKTPASFSYAGTERSTMGKPSPQKYEWPDGVGP